MQWISLGYTESPQIKQIVPGSDELVKNSNLTSDCRQKIKPDAMDLGHKPLNGPGLGLSQLDAMDLGPISHARSARTWAGPDGLV